MTEPPLATVNGCAGAAGPGIQPPQRPAQPSKLASRTSTTVSSATMVAVALSANGGLQLFVAGSNVCRFELSTIAPM